MSGRFFEWSPDDSPGFVLPTTSADAWDELRLVYSPYGHNGPLERLIEIAEDLGVRAVVVERRYIDLDYRSEHSNFYSTTFLRYPSVCHRLHFFITDISEDLTDFANKGWAYRGYSVMRPIPTAPVGRTMIAPPRELTGATLCLARDTTHLWGQTFEIWAMPFVSQDAQYLRCAHSALWMMLYHAYLQHGQPRRLPHHIHDAATGGYVLGRQLPSEGLSVGQVLKALHELDMSAGHIRLPEDRTTSKSDHRLSLYAIVCRYVNSQMPPMVYSPRHAWVVVGYRKESKGPGHDSTVLFRHDDAKGPYLTVQSPWEAEGEEDVYLPWKAVVPPLPQKVYMTGERAELVGETRLRRRAVALGKANLVRSAHDEGTLTVRTYAIRSHEFKAKAEGRLPQQLAALYRLAHWPRWIWVVEAIDRNYPDANPPMPGTIGEVIIDATASDLAGFNDPVVLTRHVGGEATLYTPDHGEVHRVLIEDLKPYPSGYKHWDGQPAEDEPK